MPAQPPHDTEHVERLITSAVAQGEPPASNADQPIVEPDAGMPLVVVEHKEQVT